MATTFPLPFPSVGVRTAVMRQVARVAGAPSIFTGHMQTHKHQGQWFEIDVGYPPLKAANADLVLANFLIRLNSKQGTFNMGDPSRTTNLGSAAVTPGTPVVMGAAQTGDELDVDGLPVSTTGYLLNGDYIQLGSGATARLHVVLDNVDTNSGGQATINIWPDLRSSPTDNDPVVVNNAVGLFRLKQPATWSIDEALFYSISFQAMEAL